MSMRGRCGCRLTLGVAELDCIDTPSVANGPVPVAWCLHAAHPLRSAITQTMATVTWSRDHPRLAMAGHHRSNDGATRAAQARSCGSGMGIMKRPPHSRM